MAAAQTIHLHGHMEILGLEIASDLMMVLVQLPTMKRQALPCNPSSLAAAVPGEGLELMLAVRSGGYQGTAGRSLFQNSYALFSLKNRESPCVLQLVSQNENVSICGMADEQDEAYHCQ